MTALCTAVLWSDLRDGKRNSEFPRPTAGREGIQSRTVCRLAGEDKEGQVCAVMIVCTNQPACTDFPNVVAERHIFGGAHPGGSVIFVNENAEKRENNEFLNEN